METEERTDLTDEETTLDHEESIGESMSATLKLFLFAILGVAALMSLWVLLPMFFTYLSEGSMRA
ncbi:MAG: hypothetical protein EXR80_06785 [Methylococcales bacterium]|nr:hypothetical protein [Methylococcales bacterium]